MILLETVRYYNMSHIYVQRISMFVMHMSINIVKIYRVISNLYNSRTEHLNKLSSNLIDNLIIFYYIHVQ